MITITKLQGKHALGYHGGSLTLSEKVLKDLGLSEGAQDLDTEEKRADWYRTVRAAMVKARSGATTKRERERWKFHLGALDSMQDEGGIVRTGYYTDESKNEKPVFWMGGGVEAVGQEEGAAVDSEQFYNIFRGLHPDTGEPLQPGRSTPGDKKRIYAYDFGVSVPKSASVLWAVADEDTKKAFEEEFLDSLPEAFEVMEKYGCRSQRGAQGKYQVMGEGFIEMVAVHRTSRPTEKGVPGDPQFHAHVVVPNITRGPDGKWRALDSPELFAWYREVGAVHGAIFRRRLADRLGVTWTTPDEKGNSEIVGVPKDLCDFFSKRREEIEKEVSGDLDAAAYRRASLKTRQGKEGGYSTEQLRDFWQHEAETRFGVTPETLLEQALEAGKNYRLSKEAEAEELSWQDDVRRRGSKEDLLAALTEKDSTFTYGRALRVVAERAEILELRTTAEIEAGAATLLKQKGVVRVSAGLDSADQVEDGYTVRTKDAERYTTQDVIDAEKKVYAVLENGFGAGVAVLPPSVVSSTFESLKERRIELGEDQREMVRRLAQDGNRGSLVEAPAGSGKTFTLGVYNQAATKGGYQVIGVSTSGKAARELENGSGIPSSTIDSLLVQLREGTTKLDRNTVLVVDEVGMVGSRHLEALVSAVQRRGGKAVLVGDHKQLTAVTAGGLFTDLTRDHDDQIIRLSENRRQNEEWERKLLDRVREVASEDEAKAIVAEYREHGSIVEYDNREDLHAGMVNAYFARTAETVGEGDDKRQKTAVMLAYTRQGAADLNQLAYARADELGMLGESVEFGGREWRPGQRVLCGRNDKRFGALNGLGGEVVAVKPTATSWKLTGKVGKRTVSFHTSSEAKKGDDLKLGSETFKVSKVEATGKETRLIVRTDDGLVVALDEEYVEKGNLADGYALTVHKSQGGTFDHSLIDPTGFNRNLMYVAASRGREPAAFYMEKAAEVHRDVEGCHLPDSAQEVPTVDERLYGYLLRSGDEDTAHYHYESRLGADLDWLELEDRRRQLARALIEAPPSSAAMRAQIAPELEEARRLGDSEMVEALESRVKDLTPRRDYTPEEDLARQAWLAQHQDLVDEWEEVSERYDRSTAAIAAYAQEAKPHYLPELPEGQDARLKWQKKVAAIETYRFRNGADPEDLTLEDPLGPEPEEPSARVEWVETRRFLESLEVGVGTPGPEVGVDMEPQVAVQAA